MGKKSKRKKPRKELKKLLKVKSDELNAMIKKAPEGLLDLEEVKARIREIDVIKQRIADVGKSHFQRRNIGCEITKAKSRADELRQKYDPNLREINQKYMERFMLEVALRCPKCGEPDHENRMDGKPWCFKCNSPLISESRLEEWRKQGGSRNLSKTEVREEIKRILEPGLNPKEEGKYPRNLTFNPLEV